MIFNIPDIKLGEHSAENSYIIITKAEFYTVQTWECLFVDTFSSLFIMTFFPIEGNYTEILIFCLFIDNFFLQTNISTLFI